MRTHGSWLETVMAVMAVMAGLELGTAHAADAVPAIPQENPSPAASDYHSVSGFGSWLIDDTTATFLAPLRWDGHDWLLTGATTVGIVGVGLLWDKKIERDSQKIGNQARTKPWIRMHLKCAFNQWL